jgi:hypothetical protein
MHGNTIKKSNKYLLVLTDSESLETAASNEAAEQKKDAWR